MKEIITTVTSKGQVTIPVEIRRALGLKARDRVAFTLTDSGAELRPAESVIDKLAGSIRPHKKPVDFKELRRTAIEQVVRNVEREMGWAPRRPRRRSRSQPS